MDRHLRKLFAVVLGLILIPYRVESLSFILEKKERSWYVYVQVSFSSPWISRWNSLGLWVLLSLLFHCKDNHCTVASDDMYVSEKGFGDFSQPYALCKDVV